MKKITTRYKQCSSEMCHCGLYISQEKTHYAYIDFCDNDESLVYENKLELRYYNSKTHLNTRVNCMNYLGVENNGSEWLNVASNINDTFKCARFDNEMTSSYLIRINDLMNVRYDIDFDAESKWKKLLRRIAIDIIDENESDSSFDGSFGGLCGNIGHHACDDEDKFEKEDDESLLYSYWK
jgi:hypothetical protein